MNHGKILIDVQDVWKSFGDHHVLTGVSMQVREGSSDVILGRSGIGKSVLLKSIVGLLTPERGSIEVMGQQVMGMRPSDLNKLRKNFGYVFQYAALYDSLTVRENLEFPLRKHTDAGEEEIEERVFEQLRLVGLEASVEKMPSELSGGMKKRIGLARAIITRPAIVLYDEPTAGLDPITAREISELILSLEEQFGITSITVTHDLECARLIAHRIHILENGCFQVTGTFDELKRSADPTTKAFFQVVT
ncbi:MAG: ATP-binding cassette domain-containing protein [Bacteroidota bacterium]|jgi:phospholipid/cholesterol/gamma-HCH transport system ATP-binding protein|nr:ATP-binding cassette domain-containing protein [Bacteroidota bacterium]